MMGIGFSILLVAIGAILMAAGVSGLILTMVVAARAADGRSDSCTAWASVQSC
jgi:hypothetical protein